MSPSDISRRIGRFRITMELIELCDPGVRQVMAACVVVDCRPLYPRAFEYTALCPHFEPVAEGTRIPLYEWHFTRTEPLGCIEMRAVWVTNA